MSRISIYTRNLEPNKSAIIVDSLNYPTIPFATKLFPSILTSSSAVKELSSLTLKLVWWQVGNSSGASGSSVRYKNQSPERQLNWIFCIPSTLGQRPLVKSFSNLTSPANWPMPINSDPLIFVGNAFSLLASVMLKFVISGSSALLVFVSADASF